MGAHDEPSLASKCLLLGSLPKLRTTIASLRRSATPTLTQKHVETTSRCLRY